MILESYAYLFKPLLVPVDYRVKKVMEFAKIDGRDLAIFYREFLKMDKYNIGKVTIPQFYRSIDEKRSRLGDAIFEILQIDYSEGISFGEFLHTIILMCMFESKEVIQLLFFVFDSDKNGFINGEEIEAMTSAFCEICETKKAIKFNLPPDGKIELHKVEYIIKSHKEVKYATFSMQNKLMAKFKGHSWWRKKKLNLLSLREQQLSEEYYAKRANDVYEKWRQRKIRKKMGYIQYYFMQQRRIEFDEIYQPKQTQDYAKTDAEGINIPLAKQNGEEKIGRPPKHADAETSPREQQTPCEKTAKIYYIFVAQSTVEGRSSEINSTDYKEQILDQDIGKVASSAERKTRMKQRRKWLKNRAINVDLS